MLVGRSVELSRLNRLVADAKDGQARSLVVRGEAGIGKTAVLDHAASVAAGMRVLRVEGSDDLCHTTQASADLMRSLYAGMAANVIGRRLFDMTNGWNGTPAAGEHVFVVTHEPPKDWEYDRVIDVAAGQIGGQALKLGLIDQVVVNLVPTVFGSGRPFYATGALDSPILLDNPSQVVQGDRVTHLVYDVRKG